LFIYSDNNPFYMPKSVDPILKSFFEFKAMHTAPTTVENIQSVVNDYITKTGLSPSNITLENKEQIRLLTRTYFTTFKGEPSSKRLYLTWVKHFIAWRLREVGNRGYRPLTDWIFQDIRLPAVHASPVTEKDIILYSEWEMCFQCFDRWRDKFIISALFEGGFRHNELLATNVGDWTIHDSYVEAHIKEGKTGERDTPPMLVTAYYLRMYLTHEHPDPTNPNAPMVVSLSHKRRGERLTRLDKLMDMLNHRIGGKLGKHIHAHMFRKGCCSYLYLMGRDDLATRKWLGWSPDSTTPQHIYRFVDMMREKSTYLAEMGVVEEGGETHEIPKSKVCACGVSNTASALFCSQCGRALSHSAVGVAVKIERRMINSYSYSCSSMRHSSRSCEQRCRVCRRANSPPSIFFTSAGASVFASLRLCLGEV